MNETVKNIISQITPILEKYPVAKAGLFGSIVRGEDTTDSDIDILVEFLPETKIGFLKFIEMKEKISKILGKKVDLVQYRLIKPALKEYILPTEIRIYEKNS